MVIDVVKLVVWLILFWSVCSEIQPSVRVWLLSIGPGTGMGTGTGMGMGTANGTGTGTGTGVGSGRWNEKIF